MNIFALPGFSIGFYLDHVYGLPEHFVIGIWELNETTSMGGTMPEEAKIFLGSGEAFNNWRWDGSEETPVFVRIRQAGLIAIESVGMLDPEGLTLTEPGKLFRGFPGSDLMRVLLKKP